MTPARGQAAARLSDTTSRNLKAPGIVTVDSDGPDIDLDALAEASREAEELNRRCR